MMGLDEDKRKKEIIDVTERIYNKNIENLEENLEAYIELTLNKFLYSDTSLDDIEKEMSKLIDEKIKLSEWISENYIKYLKIVEIINSIASVSENEIQEFLLKNINDLTTMPNENIIKKITNEFSKYRTTEFYYNQKIPYIIQNILSSSQTMSLLTKVLCNGETQCEHTDTVIDGAYLGSNIIKTQKIIGFLMQYIIIFASDYKINEVFSVLNSIDLNEIDENELNQFFCKIMARAISSKLNLNETNSMEAKNKIIEFLYENYIENGFCAQGINGVYKESVLNNGLTSSFSIKNEEELRVINDIFQTHGLDKIFFSKLDETSELPYYYLTDNMAFAYHYSYHNPEWFSYFVATGNYMPDYKYDRSAYYFRNYNGCKQNVEKLLEAYNIIGKSKETVINFFEKSWKEIVQNNSSNLITFVPRKLISRNIIEPLIPEKIENMSVDNIVEYFLESRYPIDRHYIDIPKEHCITIDVPSLRDLYNEKGLNKSKAKYIKTKDGSKYYYDILINADEIDYDCITIEDKKETPQKEELISYSGKQIDIVHCSKNIHPYHGLMNGKPSYQSMAMMIAVNGKPNSKKGKELIDRCREYFPVSYMKHYYYHLCQLCCELSLYDEYPISSRASALYRMATDFYPKAELMFRTGNYPEFISSQKRVFSYLDFSEQQLLDKIIELRNVNKSDDNTAIQTIVEKFKKKLEGKIEKKFSPEFYHQLEILGFSKYIKRNKSQMLINSAVEATKEVTKTSTINQFRQYIELSQIDKEKENERKI